MFPVKEGGKEPAIANGYKAASGDKAEVAAWFLKRPKSNYGIPTGAASGFFVLDVDGAEGGASLGELINKHGLLPKTLRVTTPHGEHYYFKSPSHPFSNLVGRLAKGLDIRGDGGYVFVPEPNRRRRVSICARTRVEEVESPRLRRGFST